jgi:Tfp pilus assembly protein PilF
LQESAQNLEKLIDLTSPDDRNELLDAIGHTYARAKDTTAAATVLGAKLRPWQQEEATASSAYTALARVQAAANMKAASRASLTEALRHTPRTPSAGILSAEWLDSSGVRPLPAASKSMDRWRRATETAHGHPAGTLA